MGIEWFRDLIICILGVVTIAVLILFAVLAYSIYRKSQYLLATVDLICERANSILDTIESTSETLHGIVANIKEAVVSPVAQIIAIIQGIRQGINLVSNLFKKEGEAENE
jgi:predicted PurR-regulated permease PerM